MSLHKKEALAAARRHNLPELMGVPEDEVAARMLAYKWTNFTAGYLQDALEAIATQVGIGKGSRSMTVFELRPEEVDDLRRGYIRYLGDQAPFEPQYGAGEWEWAFARPQRRMMDSQFLLSHPRSEELIEFAATQVAHGTYAYHRKWSEYSLFAADMALDPEGSTPPIPWPLLSADNFLINWVSNGGSASLPDEPGRESDALLERWNFLADRPNHTAYIVPGLYQVFGVESDCPCGGLVPYDSEADRMPQVSIEYGPSYQPPLYLPVPLKQY